MVMFFMFYTLILTFIQLSYTNSALVPRKIKSEDARLGSTTSTSFKTFFKFMQNHTFTKSTINNLKSHGIDQMLSEEMFSMKQLLYNKDKTKANTPALEIKQKWPIIEFMSKLSKNNRADEDDFDNLDINMLGNNSIVNDSRNLHEELQNLNDQPSNTNLRTVIQYVDIETEVTTKFYAELHNTSEQVTKNVETSTQSTPVISIVNFSSHYNQILNENKDKKQPTTVTIQNEPTIIIDGRQSKTRDERTALNDDEEWVDEVLELKSLRRDQHSSKKPSVVNHNKVCTCKKTHGPDFSTSIRCTASSFHNTENSNNNEDPCSSKEPSHEIPSTTHQCTASSSINYPNYPIDVYPPTLPAPTTCFTIPTVNVYTTCYPVYPSTIPPYPSSDSYPASIYYQPYPMFMEIQQPPNADEYKPVKKRKHHKSKRYKENDEKTYYVDDYDYLQNEMDTERPLPSVPTLAPHKHCKDVLLKDNHQNCEEGCTRGPYDRNKDEFVNEIIKDLKYIHGDSVIKDCYCCALHKEANHALRTQFATVIGPYDTLLFFLLSCIYVINNM